MSAEKQRTTKKVAKKAADRAAAPPEDPGLFAALEQRRVIVKAADRAEETSRETRAKAEAHHEAAAGVDIRKPVYMAADYVAEWNALIDGINTSDESARTHAIWSSQADLRQSLGLELKAERLLRAALDGRCNRVRDGMLVGATTLLEPNAPAPAARRTRKKKTA